MCVKVSLCVRETVWVTAGVYGCERVHETRATLRYVYGAEYSGSIFECLRFL